MPSLKRQLRGDWQAITPTLQISGAYSQYDVVGGAMSLVTGGDITLRQVIVQDDGDQKEPYKLYFFRADPDIADDAAFAPTDAELDNLAGSVSILASNYDEWGGANTVADIQDLNIELTGATTFYVYAVAQDTPDHSGGAASDLTFQFVYWTHKG